MNKILLFIKKNYLWIIMILCLIITLLIAEDVFEKVNNKDFKKILEKELNDYRTIEDKINEIYTKYGEGEPHKIGTMSKMMTDSMLGTKTMMDHSDSKIAELLLQGTNMGIIE